MRNPNIYKFLAPAKLNLGLKIVGQLANGYHEINSIFCLIGLYDQIEIEITDKSPINLVEHNYPWAIEDDLAYKAAYALQTYTKTSYGAQIKIHKSIPTQAGMGGGSSDAATILIALNYLWQTKLSLEELTSIGIKLGADVPFFIFGHNAYVTGIGEVCKNISLKPLYFVVIKPNIGCNTKKIFTSLNLPSSYAGEKFSQEQLLISMENDLQKVACQLNPELQQLQNALTEYGNPIMTGSGSAFFLAYDSLESAKKVATKLKIRYNSLLVRGLGTSPMCKFI